MRMVLSTVWLIIWCLTLFVWIKMWRMIQIFVFYWIHRHKNQYETFLLWQSGPEMMEKGSCSHAHVKLNMLMSWSNSSPHAQWPFLYGTKRATRIPSSCHMTNGTEWTNHHGLIYSTSRLCLNTPCNNLDTAGSSSGMNRHTGTKQHQPENKDKWWSNHF